MGPIGYPEMVFIFVLALLLFGPKKLPELGRTIGKAWTEFNRAKNDMKATFDREMRSLERETESIKEVTNTYYNDSYNYDYANYDASEPHASHVSDSIPALEESTTGASATEGAGLSHPEPSHYEPGSTNGSHPGSYPPPAGTIASGSLHEPAAASHVLVAEPVHLAEKATPAVVTPAD